MALRITLVVACSVAWFALVSPATGDCQLAGPIEEALPAAPVAFVGTVTEVDGPIATFAVSEVWAGDVGDVVTVRGLFDEVVPPDGGFGAGFSEDDRRWTEGATYLVLPFVDAGVLRDNQCTATSEWQPELEALRPADARIVSSAVTTETAAQVPVELLLVGGALLLVAAGSVLAFRRR